MALERDRSKKRKEERIKKRHSKEKPKQSTSLHAEPYISKINLNKINELYKSQLADITFLNSEPTKP